MSICHHGINVMNHRCDICEEIAAAEHRAFGRDHEASGILVSARASDSVRDRKKARALLLMKQAKQYAHCNCPEDEETGRVTRHGNCQRHLMPILEELESLL